MNTEFEKINQKYKELLFLSNPDLNHLKLILFIHSINLSNNLICTGLLEDDPKDSYLLPPQWDKSQCDIYSFRYEIEQTCIYFKINYDRNSDILEINAINSKNTGHILTFQINSINIISFDSEKELTTIINNYSSKFLSSLIKLKEKEKKEIKNVQNPQPQPESNFFWSRPRNIDDPSQNFPNFGDFGGSDLRPIPIGGNINSGGSLLGPDNPIFAGRGNFNGNDPRVPGFGPQPNIRFDPFGPPGINGSFNSYENNNRFF